MGAINFDDVYADASVRNAVEVVTEQQIRKIPSLALYRDDIQQELWICIAKALEKFNLRHQCSLQTFLDNVIERRVINICRHFISIHGLFSGTVHDVNEDSPAFAQDSVRLAELRMDLAVVLERLSPTQRQICQWIMDGISMKGIARRMKIPYSSLFHFYVDGIRDEFEKEKMQKYLENL